MLTVACCAVLSISASPLTHFSANGPEALCWWHCAESVRFTQGDRRPLVSEVIRSGDVRADLYSVGRFVEVWPVLSFKEAVERNGRGEHVIATLAYPAGRHAVVIIDFQGAKVVYWDPNKGERYRTMPSQEFSRRYAIGTVIVSRK